MPAPARTATEMILGMAPMLRPGLYVFVTIGDPATAASLRPQALATFAEDEGMSMILRADLAERAGLQVEGAMRCITLSVHSALEGVGLTAAVATALAEEDIPCNVVAAFHHDHLFVPAALAERALARLQALQDRVAKDR